MKKKKRLLFQYPEGFEGLELLQSANKDGTELAAWVNNPGGPGNFTFLGLVRPEDWDDFQKDFDSLISKHIIPVNRK